jgi:hypothetical protein
VDPSLADQAGSLADRQFFVPGIEVVGAIARMEPSIPASEDATWALGPVTLGPAEQTAGILTRAYTAEQVDDLVSGPSEIGRWARASLKFTAARWCRRTPVRGCPRSPGWSVTLRHDGVMLHSDMTASKWDTSDSRTLPTNAVPSATI